MSLLFESEIYDKVHNLVSRIRAAKAQNLLYSDFEYISIIHKQLKLKKAVDRAEVMRTND